MTFENFFALLCVISGLGIIVNICRIFYFYRITIKKWRTVEGKIISYGKVVQHDSDSSGWTDKMIYSYTMNGITFESKRFSKNIGLVVPFEYQVELKNYKKGDVVTVYYDPKNPNKSVIGNKFSYYNLATIIMSIIAFAVAYSMFETMQF